MNLARIAAGLREIAAGLEEGAADVARGPVTTIQEARVLLGGEGHPLSGTTVVRMLKERRLAGYGTGKRTRIYVLSIQAAIRRAGEGGGHLLRAHFKGGAPLRAQKEG